jgi:hypothetical protein
MAHCGSLSRFLLRFPLVVLLFVSVFPTQAGAPSGFEDIFRGIEPGKRFHALWPPANGQSILGLMVEAKKPPSPQAIFETIESPTFSSSQGQFQAGYLDYAAPDLTQNKDVDVDVTFSQLDAIASQLNKGLAKTGNATQGENSTQSTDSASKPKRTSTGFDYSSVKTSNRKATNIRVEYYTLGTLFSIIDGSLVNAKGRDFLSPQHHGWIIHRALRIDGLQYTLTSDKGFDAGFFAALLKWIPGIGASWKDKKTITLNASLPVYIGYKLWRPGQDVQGAEAKEDIDVMSLGIGDKKIDELYRGANQP